MTRLRNERGGILAMAAVMLPVFLLMCALIVDAGNWFTHKRQLQNRADAAALAAGVEYLAQLSNCTDPVTRPTAAAAIANAAKQYAGDPASGGTLYNQEITNDDDLVVAINRTNVTDGADDTDGGNPCERHDPNPSDTISPDGGIWTDVKVRESNIGTLFRSFGIDLPSITARARVQVKQVIGIQHGGLPVVAESGDTIECVWAKFVRASDGTTNGFSVSPENPIELTGGPYEWTAEVDNVDFLEGDDDVAIEYWAGSRNGSQECDFDAISNKRPLPHLIDREESPVATDWLNVYNGGPATGALAGAPILRQFSLQPGTCGGPGFVYTESTDQSVTCTVGFSATIETGAGVRGEITVEPMRTGVDPSAPVAYDTTGVSGSPKQTTVSGTIVVNPNEIVASSGYSQDYTQTGPTYLKVSWRQTTGTVGTGGQSNCATGGSNCRGTFEGDTVTGVNGAGTQKNATYQNVQQAFYTADPLGSTPLVSTSLGLATNSFENLGQTGPFTITFTHTGVDKEGIVLIRDSVQTSSNRTRAIWCGGHSEGSPSLEEAFEKGCQVPLVLNERGDSCATPEGGWPEEPSKVPLDCVRLEQGNMTGKVRVGLQRRFECTDNNWMQGGPLPPDGDPRWAYLPLTGFGRIIPAPNNGFLPIEAFVRIYVTGWGGKNFADEGGPNPQIPCWTENERPPRGYDGNGAQFWGHMVDIVVLNDDVIIGDEECNLDASVITCKPQLVR